MITSEFPSAIKPYLLNAGDALSVGGIHTPNHRWVVSGTLAWVDTIKIGPGVSDHKWTQLRGALPKLQADCLYFIKYAPCEFEFTME